MKLGLLTILVAIINQDVPEKSENRPKHWAVLVAGSNGWYNYRHQATVAHAYQMLRAHGIPDENIITMMYDDVVNDKNNPAPGKLFNDYSHVDVYKGMHVDYREEEVTPNNFLRLLLGDKELKAQNKKVLESGPDDHLFVFFCDHGAPGLLAFPSDELLVSQLNTTLVKMHEQNRYQKMVIYVEACYAGSMFENALPNNLEIFVTTAANAQESSFACFCDDELIDSCLGDDYSYKWIVDSENHPLGNWTLRDQYMHVKSAVEGSHVTSYGDMKLISDRVGDYQAYEPEDTEAMNLIPKSIETKHRQDSSQAHLLGMKRRVETAVSDQQRVWAQRRLQRAIHYAQMVEETMNEIVERVRQTDGTPVTPPLSFNEQVTCYETVYGHYRTKCSTIQQVPEVAHQLKKLQQLCADGFSTKTIIASIFDACG